MDERREMIDKLNIYYTYFPELLETYKKDILHLHSKSTEDLRQLYNKIQIMFHQCNYINIPMGEK